MRRWFDLVLHHRSLTVLLVLALSLVAAASLSRAHLGSSIQKIFFGDSPAYQHYRDLAGTFANDEAFVVGWSDPEPLSAASVERLRRATRAVEDHPDVARVDSLQTAPWVRMVDGALQVESYGDAAATGDRAAAAAALAADEQLAGLLVDGPGGATAALVELTIAKRSGEQGPAIFADVMDRFVAAGFQRDELHAAGFPPVIAEILRQSYLNLAALFPVTALLLISTVWLVFRRLLPALVTGGVSLVAVLWTMGFATALDPELNIFLTIAPAVIMIVGFADVIHLYSATLTELRGGKSKDEAILASATDVGTACLFTSITTFVGFLGLAAVPTPMFRTMAVVLAFGVAVALLLAMTLTPIVLSWLAVPDVAEAAPSRFDRLLDGLLVRCADLTTHRPWWVIGAWAVVLGMALAGASQIQVETDMLSRLSADNQVRADDAWFKRHFSGTSTFDLYVTSPDAEGALDPDLFGRVARAEDAIEALPDVDRVGSLVDVVGVLHRTLGGEGALPTTREGLAQTLLLFELSGGEGLDRLVDFERRTLHLTARIGPTGFRSVFQASQDAEQAAREAIGPELLARGVQVEATGMIPLLGWWLDRILLGQKLGFSFSFVVIAGLMILALRSVRAGLWSMLPNTLPLLALAGTIGFAWDRVDSDTFVIALLAVGIGVDDTIHFLVRYRLEAERTPSMSQAIAKTFSFAGRAIVITTVILVVGFLPFAFTDYFSTRIFGTLLPMVLIVALSADMLLVPALLAVGWMRLGVGPGAAGATR